MRGTSVRRLLWTVSKRHLNITRIWRMSQDNRLVARDWRLKLATEDKSTTLTGRQTVPHVDKTLRKKRRLIVQEHRRLKISMGWHLATVLI